MEDVLTACFLSVISRVTQLASKQGEERGRRRDKVEGGKEKRKESVSWEWSISRDEAEKWLKMGRKGRVATVYGTFQEVYPNKHYIHTSIAHTFSHVFRF